MFLKPGRTALLLVAAAQLLVLLPYDGDARAQRGERPAPQRDPHHQVRDHDAREHRERSRDRRTWRDSLHIRWTPASRRHWRSQRRQD